MIECTLIDNATGKVLSTNFKVSSKELTENKTYKDIHIKGIYKITYMDTDQVYIGSSKDIQVRWSKHIQELNNNKHHSWKLQEAWNREPDKNKFKFDIIEFVDDKTNLYDREQYWINYYDAASHSNFNILKDAGVQFTKDDILNFRILQQNKCGNFISFNMNTISELVELLGDSGMVKFIFLSTYIKKDNVLILDNSKTYITKKNMQKLFNLTKANFNKFYNKLIEVNLLMIKNNHYYINEKYVTRRQSKMNRKTTNYTKLYIKQIRKLFLDLKFNKKLSSMLKIIPYINYTYNIICSNPECDDINLINPLKISIFCKENNYSIKHSMDLKNTLLSFNINGENVIKLIENKKYYIINPKVIYKTANLHVFEKLIDIFENNKEEF